MKNCMPCLNFVTWGSNRDDKKGPGGQSPSAAPLIRINGAVSEEIVVVEPTFMSHESIMGRKS